MMLEDRVKGVVLGVTLAAVAQVAYHYYTMRSADRDAQTARRSSRRGRGSAGRADEDISAGVESLIGDTPLLLIRSLSAATGCEILGKCEFLNPGGSPKDRVALSILRACEASGSIVPGRGDTIYEGTVGSTGISLALLSRALGYRAHICMPDDQAAEKTNLLQALGATVERVRPASIVDKRQFVNLAKRRAAEHTAARHDVASASAGAAATAATAPSAGKTTGHDSTTSSGERLEASVGVFADQFENAHNWRSHYLSTAPEIFAQTGGGRLDAVVLGSGTGGTLSGLALYLKPRAPHAPRVVLADPAGSSLFNKVRHGVLHGEFDGEGTRRRSQVDSIVEGIGLNRLTANFEASYGRGLIDDAVKVSDREAVAMSRWIVEHDGLFLGSSSAVNLVAACRYAIMLKRQGKRGQGEGGKVRVVTILCDPGTRHLSKFQSPTYLAQAGLADSRLRFDADGEMVFYAEELGEQSETQLATAGETVTTAL